MHRSYFLERGGGGREWRCWRVGQWLVTAIKAFGLPVLSGIAGGPAT